MTTVFGGETRNEGWLPYRFEAVPINDSCDAGEKGIGEQRPSVGTEPHVMSVEIACDPPYMGRIDSVEAISADLARCQQIIKAVDLKLSGKRERTAVVGDSKAHAARECTLEYRQAAVRFYPNKEEFARLIGRKCN
jgi:hypothetical protein